MRTNCLADLSLCEVCSNLFFVSFQSVFLSLFLLLDEFTAVKSARALETVRALLLLGCVCSMMSDADYASTNLWRIEYKYLVMKTHFLAHVFRPPIFLMSRSSETLWRQASVSLHIAEKQKSPATSRDAARLFPNEGDTAGGQHAVNGKEICQFLEWNLFFLFGINANVIKSQFGHGAWAIGADGRRSNNLSSLMSYSNETN